MEVKPKSNELKSSTHILNIIHTLIRQVFLPLETQNQSLKQTLNKFCSQIQHSQQQVSGIITIELPSPIDEIKDEDAIKNQELIVQYDQALESWTQTIKKTIQKVKEQNAETNSALSEIEIWRQKQAILSMLHQQLSHNLINIVKNRVKQAQADSLQATPTVMDFEAQMKELSKMYNEAKDSVKFLTTLEKQFKTLANEGLAGVEEILPSLMNGLRTIWIISRHYKSDDKMKVLLNLISNEIADKVEIAIKIQELFKLDDKLPYEAQLSKVLVLINQGKKILKTWQNLHKQTKQKIEEEGVDRWDFQVTALDNRIKNMIHVLEDLYIMADVLKKFLVFLGPNLKAVTGNSEGIDQLVGEVKKLIIPFEKSDTNFFNKSYQHTWAQMFAKFKQEKKTIEENTIKLIHDTFKDLFLRSSEGAFELLQKFKNVATLDDIQDNLQKKYSEVLKRYTKEVENNYKLFEKGKDALKNGDERSVINKNKPPVAGAISWARSIFHRIKRPMMKFLSKEENLNKGLTKDGSEGDEFKNQKTEYKVLAKAIDEYQKQKFREWNDKIMEKAMNFLKEKILVRVDEFHYKVNFSDEFKVLIKEARHLEKMGYPISKTIINISLQEKEYYRYIDRLHVMLKEYSNAVHSLTEIEKVLLKNPIKILNSTLAPGYESLNLSSLGIPDFINNCTTSINEFRDMKKSVEKSASTIEQFVKCIEDALLLREYIFLPKRESSQMPTVIEFMAHFDDHMNRVIAENVENYNLVGNNYLKQIEATVFSKENKKQPQMKEYYYYWERRVYNALVKMVLRALLSYKNLLAQPTPKPYPLFYITAEYDHPNLNTHPPLMTEVPNYLKKIEQNIMESTKHFWRWKDGTCQFCEQVKGPNDELIQKHTFFDAVSDNPVIRVVFFQIGIIKNKALDKADSFKEMWNDEKKKELWDHKRKLNVDKLIDKNPPTPLLERYMMKYRNMIQELKEMPKSRNAFFIQVNFENVIKAFELQAHEWLNKYGNVLKQLGIKDLEQIMKDIAEYKEKLQIDAKNIDELKQMLNNITFIKNQSMIMEFRISDVTEKFRTLKLQDQNVEQDKLELAFSLEQKWKDLVKEAIKKDNELAETKKQQAAVTEEQVASFKAELKAIYEEYVKSGPGSPEITLDDGLESLNKYKEMCAEMNQKKDGLVLAEKLFNLPISIFKELVAIEEEIKKLNDFYELYKQFKAYQKEKSQDLWAKLDAELLRQGAEEFDKKRRKMAKGNDDNCIFKKLSQKITEFKDSIPLIQQLKSGSITDRHWKKLMDKTNIKIEANIKTLTLEQVFALNLQDHPDVVNDIVIEASQEHKNEEEISKIEQFWKTAQFDMVKYKRGHEERSMVLKNTDDIKVMLEDQQANLQTVASSKYVAAFATQVRKWEKDLNRISECIDVWMIVQKKWMYLEGIFMGSDDIKQQLKEEAKKFYKNDKAFIKIMEITYKNPNILSCCVANESRLMELKTLSDDLDKRQKSLSDYLDTKRNIFPRFYFLSDEDLLSILGNSEVKAVQPHMLKLFDNCRELLVARSGKAVIGMKSDEDETFQFREQQKPEGAVELWMTKVDQEMQTTLHRKTKEAVFNYHNKERIPWILENIGMIAIVGGQIWWTWRVEDVFRKVREGDKHGMKNENAKQSKDLNDLIDLVRTELNSQDRKKVNTMIIIDVHARDIVSMFVRDSILDAKEFEWESQLRFYWENNLNNIVIRQCTGSFSYGYEYEGLNGRLVITPLTDRCVMTLTTALNFKLGGAPAGPAGTGKTETVKDLAKSVAIRCTVTNCGEGLDYKGMGIIFSGLSQTGFWGCFDEFNRISPEVLSVVSVQIKTIQNALHQDKKTIELLKKEITIKSTVGIFVTMNPGYAGRTELPDNVKALFRPVTMVVPDTNIICEIMLMSEGFNEARTLAKKMNVLYKLASEQLSKQYHYDFGLRALKSVLVMAGALKREAQDIAEDATLMRALRDMNMPKFVFEDVPLFLGLIKDLFPSMNVNRKPYDKRDKINQVAESLGLQKELSKQIDKVVQLYETMLTRHTTMVVGPTGSGKSAVINILKGVEQAHAFCMNAKSITVNELYGTMDMVTREWKDGLLSKIFRVANEKPASGKEEARWILFDGDVDAVWVENMNSVMDDNKLLTLINGDRIRLERFCKLLFEVYDLQYASPATISRCGMVYVDPKDLGYTPFWEKWMMKWTGQSGQSSQNPQNAQTGQPDQNAQNVQAVQSNKYETLIDCLNENFQKYVHPLIKLIYDGEDGEEIVAPLQFELPRTNLNLVEQLTRMLDTMLGEEEPTQDPDKLEFIFVFSLVWSFGTCLKQDSRKRFEEYLKKLSGRVFPPTSLFDNYYDLEGRNFINWERLVPEYKPPEDGKFNKILVPTVDTKRFSYILSLQINEKGFKRPCIFVGESGTAKSVIIQNFMNSLNTNVWMKLNINFSSRTTSKDLQLNIEDNIDKRAGRVFGPKQPGKKLLIFIDDLHMPFVDKYGTQQPIAFLKFLVEMGYFYERGGNLDQKIIKDIQYLSAMLPPGGGTNSVDPRFLSLYSCFTLFFPSTEAVERIYNSILKAHTDPFKIAEITELVPKIGSGTLKIYKEIVSQLPRTPVKFHYIFNLRDLSRIYQGLCRSNIDTFPTKETFLRLWRNEIERVFSDRLIQQADRDVVQKILISVIKESFSDVEEQIMANPILIGDYMDANPADPEIIDPRIYKDCGSFDTIQKKFNQLLQDYNDTDGMKQMNLVLFNDALMQLTRIHRMVRFPRGHALLVGFGGSGKQSLTRLSAYTAGYKVFTINLTRGYKEREFREDLKNLYLQLATDQTLFLFTDAHVIEEGFLELVNNMLTIGMVPALIDEDGKNQLGDKIREEAKKKGINETKEDLWNYFCEKAADNLHIVLSMSPAGDTLRIRCRNFPGIVSNAGINWFFPWPQDALQCVANNYLEEIELPAENRENIVKHIVMVHTTVQDYSVEYEQQLRRKNYSTPKNYLDFLSNYKKMLTNNRTKFNGMVVRYENGLQKLQQASVQVEVLQADLQKMQVEVNAKKSDVEKLLDQIKTKQSTASVAKTEASEKKKQLDSDSIIIAQEKKKAEEILEQAKPILKEAEQELNNIKQKDLDFLKSLPKPAETVMNVCFALMVLKPNDTDNPEDGWNGARQMMSNPSSFIQKLKLFGQNKIFTGKVTDKMVKRVREKVEDKTMSDEAIQSASSAAYSLFKWIKSTLNLYGVHKQVEPLQQRVDEMIMKSNKLEKDLQTTEELLTNLNKELQVLNENRTEQQGILDQLTAQAQLMEKRLNAAKKLINGLGREKIRWTQDKELLAEKTKKLIGDCLSCSSFLSYAGPFDHSFRKKMVYEHWRNDVKDKELPMSEQFKLEDLLTSEVEIAQWNAESLPSDELSIQNGILTTRASRWPLCIDPQQQAVQWIKRKEEKDTGFKIMNLNDGSTVFLKSLENCIRFGKPFLFENVDVELDPILDPILEKNFIMKAGIKFIKLGDNAFDYNEDFRLYFTTKLANPKYTPEIMGKTMVINYTVTLMGLRDQLLNVVVGFERPDKEKQRVELVQTMSENKKKLKQAEDDLLRRLAEAEGSLLDNDQLIETLEQTKQKSIEIAEDIKIGELTSQEIEVARQSYAPVAKRGAILFFAMTSLSSISEMYEYSLSSYLGVFNKSLKDARKDNILQSRLRNINERLTHGVYDYTCLGIFGKHILTFSFQMTIMIQEGEGQLNQAELDFFLKGNTSLESVTRAKPCKFVPDQGWKDMQKLVAINETYKDLINDLERNQEEWEKWYSLEKPELQELPRTLSKLTSFQMLLILRCFRPDRVVNGVKKFINEFYNNQCYIQPPTAEFDKIYEQTNEKSPIVFILSPGADPLSDVQKLGEQQGFTGNKFKFLSLGQGMEQEASQFVENSSQRGHWLMLQNCHLLTAWLKSSLEKLLDQMQKPHKDFRLWLTTQPTDKFPLGILQKSLKIVTEPPDGLKSNMKSTLSKYNEEDLNSCTHPAFKPLIYIIAFFHAIIQDRRKYGKIGWNVSYDFNESDFRISYYLLSLYLSKAQANKEEAIPWSSLKYLIGEAMYGGRVTDDYDRRVLITYLDEYMGDFIFDKNPDREFFFSKTEEYKYGLPKQLNYEGFQLTMSEIPIINSPAVFGLHPNAEITYFTNAAKNLWENLLNMQSSTAIGISSQNRDSYISSMSTDIMSKLPPIWDVLKLRKEKEENISPTTIVLFQELERFNKLILKIDSSLKNLQRALKGEIGMSAELDDLAIALYNGFLPQLWARLAPQTEKKLAAWMEHFMNRVKQYKDWVNIGEPAVIWLSGIHIPESYLTALVQTTCRAKEWALDKSTLYTQITKIKNAEEIKKKPEHGCYVRGLYLEGASWDINKNCLKPQNPKELVYEMPIVQIIPIEANKLKLKDQLKSPVYVTQSRKNAMGVGLVFEANLRTEEHISHWILQGVCMILNVDY